MPQRILHVQVVFLSTTILHVRVGALDKRR